MALLFPSVAQAEASVGVWEKRVSELEATIQRSRTQMVEREEVHLQASHRAHIPTAHHYVPHIIPTLPLHFL